MNTTEYIAEMLESIEEQISQPETPAVPNPCLVTLCHNLSERRIWLDLAVDEQILEYTRFILRWNIEDAGKPIEERKPIWLYMFNYGGGADLMWMFTDIISTSDTPVYTVNVGKCCSASALIFMTGKKRFMLPSATVLIHEGSSEISGDAIKVVDQAESYKAMVKQMHDYILAHTNIPAGTLSKKKHNDWELDAKTCLKYGVCDEIVEHLSGII